VECRSQANASFFTEQLRGVVESVPVVRPWATHVNYVYVVQVRERDHFRMLLEQEGIATSIHYPIAIHLQPAAHITGMCVACYL